MIPSIRTYLLINLLLSVAIITSLAIIGNLFLAHGDIQAEFDEQLVQEAQRIETVTSGLAMHQLRLLKHTKEDIAFQIWSKHHRRLIIRSPSMPTIPSKNIKNGLSTINWHGETWRINKIISSHHNHIIEVAERYSYRQKLENQLTKDSILIMLIAYPFLGLLIWLIVGRGFNALKRVVDEVKHRAPTYLDPVDLKSVPQEIKSLVQALNDLFGKLQNAFEREQRFTNDAAHELRTPLAALSTYTQLALRAQTPEERKQALLKVLSGVNRGTHVVQQLLTLSRLNPQAEINEPVPMDLSKEAAEIAAQLAPEAIAKNIELELIAPDEPPIIIANPTAIGILIRNLVDNAIRYSPEKSTVTIMIEKYCQHMYLRVIDNGPGIPKELRERVFERFFRVIGNKTQGSGLGLGIVQQIAKLHHADINLATPQSGKGLDFQIIFRLPEHNTTD